MRCLTLVSSHLGRPDDAVLAEMEENDRYPRALLFQRTLNSDILDERFLQRAPRLRRNFYRLMPIAVAQIIEAFILRERYDIIISWAARLGYPLALLMKITGSRTPHITLNSWITKSKKAFFLKLIHSHIDRVILWNSVQRDFALHTLKLPSSKVTFLRKGPDLRFWRPMNRTTDIIGAAGTEMRDYPTLIEAMRGLDIPCHIAAGIVRTKTPHTIRVLNDSDALPPNIVVAPKSYAELRELYARSRFVVVPLLESDTDNGLTCILEAMAMGKAIICSRTRGQVDIIREGVTGVYVPQGDPRAMREAILRLWNNPELCKAMGREARATAERSYSLDKFVLSVRAIAEEVIWEKMHPSAADRPGHRVSAAQTIEPPIAASGALVQGQSHHRKRVKSKEKAEPA